MRELLVSLLVVNAMFWCLLPHSIHCDFVKNVTNNISTAILSVERAVMGTTKATLSTGTGVPVSIVSPILKFPAGTKGKNLSIRLTGQKGYIDSVGVVYKPKSIK